MGQYYDPLSQYGLVPTNQTFSKIMYNKAMELIWTNQPISTTSQHVVTSTVNLVPTADNIKLMLPNPQGGVVGANFILNNVTDFTIPVYNSLDNSLLFTINPKNSITPNAMVCQVDDANQWYFLVYGSTSNVFDISQTIGNGLQVNVDSAGANVLTIKAQSDIIQNILDKSDTNPLVYAIKYNSTALTSIGYVILIDDTLGRQAVVELNTSLGLAVDYGYSCTFINNGKYPLVLVTKPNDSINGIQNSAGAKYASFIVDIGETCQVVATRQGWWCSVTNSVYQKTFKTTQIDISTSTIIEQNGDYYIDLSSDYEVGFSQLIVMTGQTDKPIAIDKGLYLVMPNNLSTCYTLRSLINGNFNVGFGVRTKSGVVLKNTGIQQRSDTNGAVAYTYICYESNNNQLIDILPLRQPTL